MKNLNFLKLALVFAMATQSAGLLANGDSKIEEPKKEAIQKETKTTSFKDSLSGLAKSTGEFLKNHSGAVSSTLVGGAALGLGFLGGSLYTAATIKSKLEKPKSFFTATKLVIGAGLVAGLYYLWTKKGTIKTAATVFWNKEDKMTSVKDFGKKWFVEKPKKGWNWLTNLSIFKKKEDNNTETINPMPIDVVIIEKKDNKTEEVKTEEVKTEEVKTEEVKTEEVKTEEVKTEKVTE